MLVSELRKLLDELDRKHDNARVVLADAENPSLCHDITVINPECFYNLQLGEYLSHDEFGDNEPVVVLEID